MYTKTLRGAQTATDNCSNCCCLNSRLLVTQILPLVLCYWLLRQDPPALAGDTKAERENPIIKEYLLGTSWSDRFKALGKHRCIRSPGLGGGRRVRFKNIYRIHCNKSWDKTMKDSVVGNQGKAGLCLEKWEKASERNVRTELGLETKKGRKGRGGGRTFTPRVQYTNAQRLEG